jgi:hypothetical protein
MQMKSFDGADVAFARTPLLANQVNTALIFCRPLGDADQDVIAPSIVALRTLFELGNFERKVPGSDKTLSGGCHRSVNGPLPNAPTIAT